MAPKKTGSSSSPKKPTTPVRKMRSIKRPTKPCNDESRKEVSGGSDLPAPITSPFFMPQNMPAAYQPVPFTVNTFYPGGQPPPQFSYAPYNGMISHPSGTYGGNPYTQAPPGFTPPSGQVPSQNLSPSPMSVVSSEASPVVENEGEDTAPTEPTPAVADETVDGASISLIKRIISEKEAELFTLKRIVEDLSTSKDNKTVTSSGILGGLFGGRV